MADKILSVIIPSYNMEAYLPKCLGSLVIADKDLLQGLDVIVVNDGSKDRTGEIAHGFKERYPDVFQVIDKANGHYGSCINAALPMVKGEYVKVLDADDGVDTVSFERFLRVVHEEFLKGNTSADLIVSDYVDVNPDGKVLRKSNFGVDERASSLDDFPSNGCRLTIHSICYRTKNLLRIGYRQSEGLPYTDTEWIIEPMVTVTRVRCVPLTVTRYLVGRDGQTMDPIVFAKSLQIILDITIGLIKKYADLARVCDKSAFGYYRRQVVTMVSLSYYWGLLGYEGLKTQCDMNTFDERLSQYSDFYKVSSDFNYGPNHCPFKYVAEWRAHGKNTFWKLRITVTRLLLQIATVWRFIKRI